VRSLRLISLLLVLALFLSACGPAAPTAADDMTDSGHRFTLALPRLVIDIDAQGQPSLLGLGMDDLGRLTGMQLGDLAIDQATLDMVSSAGIQHIELAHSSDGIFLYANGKPLPHIAYGDGLGNLGDVAGMFSIPYAGLIDLFAPLLQRTGLDIVLRFPLPSGATEIPLRDAAEAPQAVLAQAEEVKTRAVIELNYDVDGVPDLAGVTTRDIAEATGFSLAAAELDPAMIASMQAAGVKEVQLQSRADGIFISVNGMALPNVAWSNEVIENSADLYAQAFPASPYLKLVETFGPELNNADVDIIVNLP